MNYFQFLKVCEACFDLGPQQLGTYRKWTRVFKAIRQNKQNFDDVTDFLTASRQDNPGHVTSVRRRVNIGEQCRRLVAGFESDMGESQASRILGDVRKSIFGSLPEWQKSPLLPVSQLVTIYNTFETHLPIFRIIIVRIFFYFFSSFSYIRQIVHLVTKISRCSETSITAPFVVWPFVHKTIAQPRTC